MRLPVASKLLGIYLVPATITFLGFSLLAHHRASRLLEDELGRRLSGVAAAAASSLDDEALGLLQPGDEETRTYRNVRRRLDELAQSTGVARIYVFDDQDRSVCDTSPRPIGERYFELSRSAAELRAARNGVPTSSVLFTGADGRPYKSAFARAPGTYVVGVDGAAAMYEQLASLRRTLLSAGLAGIAVVALLSLVAARLLVTPVRTLARAALRIGRGDLDVAITRQSSDEIGDVAETLEQMRLLLRARDERTQMMLAGIAHEVRNPLGGLQLYAGLLREDLPADRPELLDYVKKVERELEHLKNIVSDFLEYARRPRPVIAALDAKGLADELIQLLASPALIANVTPGTHLDADAGQLRRALLNLLGNALQASGDGQRVTLAMRSDEHTTHLEVRDEGVGIADDALAKIWTPFFTTKQKGTGLGLAFVREIVQDHGGTIEVRSKLGAGTTFTIELPRARTSRAP